MCDFKKIEELEPRLWSAADQLQANTGLTSQEYSSPVLGLIFLRYAEYRFELAKENLLIISNKVVDFSLEQFRILSVKNNDLKKSVTCSCQSLFL